MQARWRFVGREQELDAVLEGVAGGIGTVVFGPAGVGKTALLSEAAGRLDDGRRRIERVVGAGSTEIPLEPFARLLPADGDISDERRRLTHIVDALRPRSPDDPATLLVVDDAPRLDALSGEVLVQLAGTGSAVIVATARTEDQTPEWLTRLWRGGTGERLDLAPFTPGELEHLLRSELGGDVDSACVRTFADLSAGNGLMLRELVLASLADEVLVDRDGVWVLDGTPSVGAALVDLIEDRLRTVPTDLRDALELVALGEPLAVRAARDVVGDDLLEALEEQRLITVTDTVAGAVVTAAHPIWGQVVRATTPRLRARRLQLDLARAVSAGPGGTDQVRAALWRLDADAADDPFSLAAAAGAARPFSLDIAERLARASVDADPQVASVTLLASILTSKGASAEAARFLGALPPSGLDAGDQELVLFMQSVGTGLLGGDPKAGLAMLDGPGSSVRLRGMQSSLLLVDGRVRDAYRAAAAVLDDPEADESARTVAGIGAVGGLFYLGGFEELRRRYDIAEQDATNELVANPNGLGQIQVNAFPALAEAGYLDEAAQRSQARIEGTAGGDGGFDRSRWEYSLGRVDLLRGDIDGAVHHLRRAAATPSPFDLPFHPYNVSFLARALAASGRPDEARRVVAEIDPSLPRFRLFEAEHELAEAGILAAEGNLAAAVERAAWAAELAAVRELWTVVLIAAHEVARFGRAPVVQRLAADATDRVEGELPAARARFVAAQATADGPALDRVARTFEQLGALLFAAEAAAQAARCHQQAGRAGPAAASEANYRRLLARCPGAVCPWLGGVTTTDPLTSREQEVAILAAAGRRDAELADELGISIRTVQTHLGRVYMKLDIHSRAELAEALLADRSPRT